MKKWIIGLMVILMSVVLAACTTQKDIEQPKDDQYFDAEVVEIYENSLLVSTIGGKDAPSAKEVIVGTEIYGTTPLPDIEKGTKIRIMYGGDIKESQPAQVERVFAIYLLDEIENTK